MTEPVCTPKLLEALQHFCSGCALGPCGQPWLEEGHISFISARVHCFPSDDVTGMWHICAALPGVELMKGEGRTALHMTMEGQLEFSVVRSPLAGKH